MTKQDRINQLQLIAHDDLTRSFVLKSSVESCLSSAEVDLDCFVEDNQVLAESSDIEKFRDRQRATFGIIREQLESFINSVTTKPIGSV